MTIETISSEFSAAVIYCRLLLNDMKSSILFIVVGLHILAFGLAVLGGLLFLSSISSVYPFKFLAITVFVTGAALIVAVLGGRMTWKYTKQIL
jgi:hypothetical protein